jgi:hypothetical protein
MPTPVQIDPRLEISPFALFRALKEGRPLLLVDARPEPGALTLESSIPWPGPGWVPPEDREVILFDGDGDLARETARRYPGVRALFGGLELYDFSLDPAVVGEERFLSRSSSSFDPVSRVRR